MVVTGQQPDNARGWEGPSKIGPNGDQDANHDDGHIAIVGGLRPGRIALPELLGVVVSIHFGPHPLLAPWRHANRRTNGPCRLINTVASNVAKSSKRCSRFQTTRPPSALAAARAQKRTSPRSSAESASALRARAFIRTTAGRRDRPDRNLIPVQVPSQTRPRSPIPLRARSQILVPRSPTPSPSRTPKEALLRNPSPDR